METEQPTTLADIRAAITADYIRDPRGGYRSCDSMHVLLLQYTTQAIIDRENADLGELHGLTRLAEGRSWYWMGVDHERGRV